MEMGGANVDSVRLYVDVENLMDSAKEAIVSTMDQWPDELPRPLGLRLYVRADYADLWRHWATHRYPGVEVQVAGVQHYSVRESKNSADIALILDAFADLIKGRNSSVAVLSDDSDFAGLFSKISQEVPRLESGRVPFTWFMTDRTGTRSSMLEDLMPGDYIRTVFCGTKKAAPPSDTHSPAEEEARPDDKAVAEMIIRHVAVGQFKSTDCIRLLKQHMPGHPMAKLEPAKFGTQFVKNVWPSLEQLGVRVANPGKKPRRYEMTDEAKRSVGIAD
jgi:hypothetical protein